jgi:hypothetical protein
LPLERDIQSIRQNSIRPPTHANAGVQDYQAGFQSGKSKTDQFFALRKILEKCNEFNFTTHHLFIDFKLAYDTIIRIEVYFEVVKDFVYLGSLMTPTNDVSLEIQRRIQTANRCFFGLRKYLQSSHLSRQ